MLTWLVGRLSSSLEDQVVNPR
eukprot:Gb_13913 [translate_table: standard]